MKAILATGGLPADNPEAFTLTERPSPRPLGHDLLVGVLAAGFNPVDTKVFARLDQGQSRILGWDACGRVLAIGEKVSLFEVGDMVYYAGELTRDGSNAEAQLVDERLVALAPKSLEPAQIAALALTSLTAFEGLFDRLGFTPGHEANPGKSLLVIGGAGGVGSMIIQLACWAGLHVAATAGRPQSQQWCRTLGAHTVIGRGNVAKELKDAGLPTVDAIYCTTDMQEHWQSMAEVIAPQGSIALIDDPTGPLDITVFKQKSVCLCWEFMYTRSLFKTHDMARQGQILKTVASLIDAGTVKTTLATVRQGLTVENIRQAHLDQAAKKMVGKQVIAF